MYNHFSNKNVLILSPQEWNDQHISKHHYAIEIAKRGNKVLFVEIAQPGMGISKKLVNPVPEIPNLFLAQYWQPLPYWISYRLNQWYTQINWWQVSRLIKKNLGKIDVCIDFGHYRMFRDLRRVKATYKIFFPVDDFNTLEDLDRGADLNLSVSTVIVEKLQKKGIKCHYINHGLAESFAFKAATRLEKLDKEPPNTNPIIKFGYAGNLMIRFLDRQLFKTVVETFSSCEFHCFGKCKLENPTSDDHIWFNWLHQQPNIKLHGLLNTDELSDKLQEMDALWLCYRPDNQNYHAENSHKILEYLSTGKVVVSTPISIYKNTQLLEMADHNTFVDAVANVVKHIEAFNQVERQRERITFALDNTYSKHIDRINQLLNQTTT